MKLIIATAIASACLGIFTGSWAKKATQPESESLQENQSNPLSTRSRPNPPMISLLQRHRRHSC